MAFKPYYRRRFLNRRGHHAGAYVLADCQVDVWQDASRLESSLTLADCSRTVVLDFCGGEPDQLANALHKARQLREVVNGLCDSIEEAAVEVARANAEAKKAARKAAKAKKSVR